MKSLKGIQEGLADCERHKQLNSLYYCTWDPLVRLEATQRGQNWLSTAVVVVVPLLLQS